MGRIGVGDGQRDSLDWALLMPLKGNGGADFHGQKVWAFGGEQRTNNYYTGTVKITGRCAATTNKCSGSKVLFQGPGSSSTYKNQWGGWYKAGSTVKSGSGKRVAYDTTPVYSIRLSDASGRFAEYKLNPGYAGRTLLSIVQKCMGSARTNTNAAKWRSGYCTNVGTKTSSKGSFPSKHPLSSKLRIGVGDGQKDSPDWALLMPLKGNGAQDFSGNKVWVFGGEQRTNNYYTGTVTITATCIKPQPKPTCKG